MPEVGGELVPLGEEALCLGVPYMIVSVEKFISEVRSFAGYRVAIARENEELIAIPLWEAETIGRESKLGAFVYLLGKNTDNWEGRTIEFVNWSSRNRHIKLAE